MFVITCVFFLKHPRKHTHNMKQTRTHTGL